MFTFALTNKLEKKLNKLARKDKILALIFKKKLQEVIAHDKKSIDTYKNLKSPMNEFKRIHLTDSFVLIFRVHKEKNHIIFIDILHWDRAYT